MRIFVVKGRERAEEFDDARIWCNLGKFVEIGFRNYVVVGVDAGHLASPFFLAVFWPR